MYHYLKQDDSWKCLALWWKTSLLLPLLLLLRQQFESFTNAQYQTSLLYMFTVQNSFQCATDKVIRQRKHIFSVEAGAQTDKRFMLKPPHFEFLSSLPQPLSKTDFFLLLFFFYSSFNPARLRSGPDRGGGKRCCRTSFQAVAFCVSLHLWRLTILRLLY